MSHTNSTTNYALPQFLTTDKPFWLTDVNQAYADIDAAIKAAKDAGDNAQNDATQALSDASAASSAATAADGKGAGALSSIADTYSAASTYNVGDLVIYNSLLYKNIHQITTPEAWDGTHWTRTTIENETDSIEGDISTINTNISAIRSISTATGNYDVTVGTNHILDIVQDEHIMQIAGYFRADQNIAANTNITHVSEHFKTSSYALGYSGSNPIPLVLTDNGQVYSTVAITSGTWVNFTLFGIKN